MLKLNLIKNRTDQKKEKTWTWKCRLSPHDGDVNTFCIVHVIAEVFKSKRAELHYCSLGILWLIFLAPIGNCFASILVFHLFFVFSLVEHSCPARGGWHIFFLSFLLISLFFFLFLLPFCGCFFFFFCVCRRSWRRLFSFFTFLCMFLYFKTVMIQICLCLIYLLSIPACLLLHFVLLTQLHLLHIS